jgi:hypothetical protein
MIVGYINMRIYIFLLAIAILVILGCSQNHGTCIFINKSTQEISEIKITVCKQEFLQKDIKPEKSVMINFKICADSDYQISIDFVNKKKLNKRLGYITNGVIVDDIIYIYDSDAIFADYKRGIK